MVRQDSRFWKRILRIYGLRLGPWRASQPEAPGPSNMLLWNWSPGSWESRDGTQTTGDSPPAQYGGYSTEAQRRTREEQQRTINARCRASPGSAAEAPSLDLGPKENYVAFPLSHHESAGLDKHVSSARAFRGHMVTAFIVQNGPSDSIKTKASQWLGQSGLELMSLLDVSVLFFPSSPTLVSS